MTDEPVEAVRWIVRGRVQGVGFRWFTHRAASDLGVVGWVRNEPDGAVCVEVVGRPRTVRELRGRVRVGPRSARVDAVHETRLDIIPDWASFEITS